MFIVSRDRTVFTNFILQESFKLKGYVVIPGFLDPGEIQTLNNLYVNNAPDIEGGFHVTNWTKNNLTGGIIHQGVVSLLLQKLESLLHDYKPVLGCFAVKKSGYDNRMGLHQDWSLVDEKIFDGISIWIPLVDVDGNSGALKILEASHRLFSNIRGQKIHNQLDDLDASAIRSNLTTVPMKAGEMLILHHRLVHCSDSTANKNARLAAMLAMIPREAPVRHYLAREDYDVSRGIRVFNCPNNFYVDFDIESEPANAIEIKGTFQTESLVTDEMIANFYQK